MNYNAFIEYQNGKLEKFYNEFDGNISKIKKFYLFNLKEQFGFLPNGMFFINNKIFDFKININNSTLKPFTKKTGILFFNQSNQVQNIIGHSIGYYLITDIKKYKYELSVFENNTMYFFALELENEKVVAERNLKLR